MSYAPEIIRNAAQFVRSRLSLNTAGHDWWHVERVWHMARSIARIEKADVFVVELAALFHDIADWKFHGGDADAGSRAARRWLRKVSVEPSDVDRVCEIIGSVSFRGAQDKSTMRTLEGKIVQDADRLDAIGAIGIARAFAYGGHKNRTMHDPGECPSLYTSFKEYQQSRSTTINHFYEKLLLIRDRMNTRTAKRIAAKRHKFMERFLEAFFEDWKTPFRG